MNKAELVDGVAERTGLAKTVVRSVMDACSDLTVDALARGVDVHLTGVGKLTVVRVSERKARNPRTGEALTIAAHRKPKLRASKELQDAVNRRG